MGAPLAVPILQCPSCGTRDPGPRLFCTTCHAAAPESREVPGAGVLVSFTVIRRAPARLKALAPYTVCVVDLDAGVRVTGRLTGPDAEPFNRVVCVAREDGVSIFSREA